ncbi:MAG: alpha/beta fold hydrolase [bacterium]
MIVKPINFLSENCKLSGNLYLPKNSADKKIPGIVLCHGFAGVKELLVPAYAEKFATNGFAVLAFDYRGFGASDGERGRLVSGLQVEDIKSAITFLATQTEVDKERIGLWGTSYGGANAIIVAGSDSRIRCLCVQLTFGDGERVVTANMSAEEVIRFKEMLAKMQSKKDMTRKEMMVPISKVLSDEQSKKFFQEHANDPSLNIKIPFLTVAETMKHKPELSLKNITIPFLIVGAEKDSVNPITESYGLYNAAVEPKELFVIKDATHFELYSGKYFTQAIKKELAWFNKYLLNQ